MPIIAPDEAERQRYLAAKRDKLGHLLPPRPCCGSKDGTGDECMLGGEERDGCTPAGDSALENGSTQALRTD